MSFIEINVRMQISAVELLGVQKGKRLAIGRGTICHSKQVSTGIWAIKPPLYAQTHRPVPRRYDVGKTFEDH